MRNRHDRLSKIVTMSVRESVLSFEDPSPQGRRLDGRMSSFVSWVVRMAASTVFFRILTVFDLHLCLVILKCIRGRTTDAMQNRVFDVIRSNGGPIAY